MKRDAKAAQKHRKRPRSFVLKLTIRQVMRLFFTMLALNLLLIVLYSGMVLVGAEQTVNQLIGMPVEEALEQPSALTPDLHVTLREGTPDGQGLSRHLEMELETPPGTLRDISWESIRDFLRNNAEGEVLYTVSVPQDNGLAYLEIAFDLGPGLYRFCRAMTILLCAEGILLFFSIWGIRSSVRRTLAPIQELTAAAKIFSSEPARTPNVREDMDQELELSGTIDTLNTITAKRLDTRIFVDEEREELRGLADAINSMLDRLDAAYQSQLRFVSDASHELRTPIAVIQGYANLLDRWGKEDPEALQESIEAIKAETAGMQALVEQLLFLARSDNNSIVLNPDTLDVSQLAAEVLRDTQVIDQGHQLVSDIESGLWVTGDSGLLKQAMRIFVDNAIKYTPSGERIRVSAKSEGDWVSVSVSDNGIGIPEEDLPHVFERFFRSDESRARKTGGTGLGLAIAKWTVQRHGGHVEILSRKDIGTKLTMLLPAAQPKVEDLPQAQ